MVRFARALPTPEKKIFLSKAGSRNSAASAVRVTFLFRRQMASSLLRSTGRVLRRSIPQRRSPISDFVARTQHIKYSTSSSGVQQYLNNIEKRNTVNEVKCQLLDEKMDVQTRVLCRLEEQVKELELVLEEKDAVAERYARQGLLVGVAVGFGLGFYAKQCISG